MLKTPLRGNGGEPERSPRARVALYRSSCACLPANRSAAPRRFLCRDLTGVLWGVDRGVPTRATIPLNTYQGDLTECSVGARFLVSAQARTMSSASPLIRICRERLFRGGGFKIWPMGELHLRLLPPLSTPLGAREHSRTVPCCRNAPDRL
jgi:hypothetical protein